MKHLLDTSALCAHFLHQPGADRVAALFADAGTELGVCVVSWFEMRFALERCGVSRRDVERALAIYRELPLLLLPVTDPVVDRAAELRCAAAGRLPLADALIAGCASVQEAVLVHRDAHLDAVPDRLVRKLRLPDHPTGTAVRESPVSYGTRKRRRSPPERTSRLDDGTFNIGGAPWGP